MGILGRLVDYPATVPKVPKHPEGAFHLLMLPSVDKPGLPAPKGVILATIPKRHLEAWVAAGLTEQVGPVVQVGGVVFGNVSHHLCHRQLNSAKFRP